MGSAAETVKSESASTSLLKGHLNNWRYTKLHRHFSTESFRILFSSGNINLGIMDAAHEDFLNRMEDEAILQHTARTSYYVSARSEFERFTVESDAKSVLQIALCYPEKRNNRLSNGSTPLICAARLNLKAVVDTLVTAGASVNEMDLQYKTALHWAATRRFDSPEVREILARADAYCEERLMPPDDTVGAPKPHAVNRLLDAGADVNARDKHGCTPLHSAIESNAELACRILLQHPGININVPMHDGTTPLILASRLGIKYAFDELMSAGADVKSVDADNKTALHWVADVRYKDTEAARLFVITIANSVKMLLEAGADANAQDKYGQTPLHLALETSSRPVMEILLNHPGTNVNLQSSTYGGSTPLTLASRLAMEEAVSELIRAGADVDAADSFGRTALHWTATRGRTDNEDSRSDCAELLIAADANVNAQDSEGNTPLHSAVTNAEVHVIRALLRCQKTDRNARTHGGATPLMLASHFAVKVIFDDLIRAGADVHAVDSEGKTALHWTAISREDDDRRYGPLITPNPTDFGTHRLKINTVRWSKPIAINTLLRAGADVNARDQAGRTPLHVAVETNGMEILRELLAHPTVDVNTSTHDGTTPLILAARFALRSMVKAMIRAGANLDAQDAQGKTALHWVTTNSEDDTEYSRISRPKIAKKLLEAGANANARDKHGRTPLHLALEEAAEDVLSVLVLHPSTDLNARTSDSTTPLISMVRLAMDNTFLDLIMSAGANINLADSSGYTALHWAVILNNFSAANEVLLYGANPDVVDHTGQTPLHYAAAKGSTPFCRVLIARYANRDIRDHRGRLPRDIAQEMNFPLVDNLLMREFMPGG